MPLTPTARLVDSPDGCGYQVVWFDQTDKCSVRSTFSDYNRAKEAADKISSGVNPAVALREARRP